MYNSDYNRPYDSWDRPIETTGRPVNDPYGGDGRPPKKKKGSGAKMVALALVCAMLGGTLGGSGVLLAQSYLKDNQSTTIYQSQRTEPLVNVAQVDGGKLMTADQIYEASVGSTVGITTEVVTTNYFGQPVSAAAAGSGFVITTDGYILTNYHVIEDANSITVAFVDGTTYDATLVGGEEENDIAVLKIEATGLTPVVLGNSDDIKVGEGVVAIGNPLGELTFSMTQGIVSAKDRAITMSNSEVMNMIQTDTAINSGNSGGPLFDMYGKVIGITSAKLSNNNTASSEATIEGLGFAIPVNDIVDMVTDIMEHGYVTGKAYLGITVTTIPLTDAQRYGISPGALVQSVDPASCAATAGLQTGDIIVGLDNQEVTSSADLIELKNQYGAGDTVTLQVERDRDTLELTLTFDEDSPQRRAAQEEAQAKLAEEQQSQNQTQNGGQMEDYFWPFNGLMPWIY